MKREPIKYTKQGTDTQRVAASFEPTLKRWYDSYNPPCLVGRVATEDEITGIRLSISLLLMGQETNESFQAAFSSTNSYLKWVDALSDELNSWKSDYDEQFGFTTDYINSYLETSGCEPMDIRSWFDDPAVASARADYDKVLSLISRSAQDGLQSKRDWDTFLGAIHDTVGVVEQGAKTVVATAAGAATGIALSRLMPSFAGNGVSFNPSPSGQISSFVNADIPGVVSMAFNKASAAGPVIFDTMQRKARSKAKALRKEVISKVQGRDTAVASFGNNEIRLNDDRQASPLVEAAVEAMIYDHLLFCSAYPCKPGSMDAGMYADMYDLKIMGDPDLHRKFKDWTDEPDDPDYWDEPTDWDYPTFEDPEPDEPSEDDEFNVTDIPVGDPLNPYEPVTVAEDPGFDWNEGLLKAGEAIVNGYKVYNEVNKIWQTVSPPSVQSAKTTSAHYGQPIGVFTLYNGRVVAVPMNGLPEIAAQGSAILNQFLNAPSLHAPAPAAFYTAMPPFPKSTIKTFQDARVGLGSTRSRTRVPYMSKKPAYEAVGSRYKDEECKHLFDRPGAPAPTGEFYRSSLLVAKLTDLPSRTYGQINVATMPYQIEINRNYVDSRMKVSFVHEALHAITELLKLGLSHEQLHALSVFITSEVIPGYLSLEDKLQNQLQ